MAMATVFGTRTFRTSAEGVVRLMQALTADPDVRVVRDGIPPGAAVAGVRLNGHTIEIDIVSHAWPEGTDLATPVTFMYARRYSHGGAATDWSAPISTGGN